MSDIDEYRHVTVDYAAPLTPEQIARGKHRRRVGSKWDIMGDLQRDFLVAHGMRPQHRLLDVGCGPLRAGRCFIEYLEPGNYYGIDINETLIEAGYDIELSDELRAKLPREHLRATERFRCDFGVPFDYAIANSVFTHVSLNHVRLCLFLVGRQLGPEGRFYATYFEAPPWHRLDRPMSNNKRWTERNAFFYYRRDLRWAAREAGLRVRFLGRWGHPGGQRMAEFRRARVPAPRMLAVQALERIDPRMRRAIKRRLLRR